MTTSTQLSAQVTRDIAFSYLERFPYYALTSSALSIKQRISSSWDVAARGGWQTLAYRGVTTDPGNVPFADHGQFYGMGLGYSIHDTFRIGFDANYYSRSARDSVRSFNGLRAGASVSYGISQ
jgi:hypothetical protein